MIQMGEKIEKKLRLPEQSATGNAVFIFTIITSLFYIVAGAFIIALPEMAQVSFTFQFNNIAMGALNFICAAGLICSGIPIKKRKYILGSSCILGVTIFGFVIGGGFLVAPLWGISSAMIGYITDPLEAKLYERKMAQEKVV
ncbi:MAG: hypothetical protein EAX96_13740 [Candidatus Lokiarchaeota archaeon]|nr:hypothetical protein [Candidatus Lokiarchaeota archaeon]